VIKMRNRFLLNLLVIFALLAQGNPSFALTLQPQIAQDKDSGYDRSFFKHWIDANKNGCDTRAEVLISEAIVKPKVDKKCKITGGKWLSAYDNKIITSASLLDVDHLVPLAEAWRSGAWAWTPKQRQDYANDLSDKRALIAVTLSTNRSKGDQDISEWVPKVDTCGYVQNWIAIKIRYSLTYDSKEASFLSNYFVICKFGDIPVQALSGFTYQSAPVDPVLPTPTQSATAAPTSSSSPTPTPTPTPVPQSPQNYDSTFGQTNKIVYTSQGQYDFCLAKNTLQLDSAKIAGGIPTVQDCGLSPAKQTAAAPTPTVSATPTPTPTPTTTLATVSPGAFCSPAGATGQSANGTLYTCKTSSTDTRNRWRQ